MNRRTPTPALAGLLVQRVTLSISALLVAGSRALATRVSRWSISRWRVWVPRWHGELVQLTQRGAR